MADGHRTLTLGRLVLTTTRQGGGAPLVDRSATIEHSPPYRAWTTTAIVAPWRLRRRPWTRPWRTIGPARALVIGWRRG